MYEPSLLQIALRSAGGLQGDGRLFDRPKPDQVGPRGADYGQQERERERG